MTAVAANDGMAGGDASRVLSTMTTDQPVVRRSNTPTEVRVDARFVGKSPEEIIDMYKNLESHSGRLASQLGQSQQQLTEALATAKRLADLGESRAPAGPSVTDVNGVDLIANPKQALDRIVSDVEARITKGYEGRIAQLEGQLARAQFHTNHQNVNLDDPALAAFANATPLRQHLAAQARSGNYAAADALLTEFKQFSNTVAKPVAEAAASGATRATLETPAGAAESGQGGAGSGKTYKRADIMALRMTDPEKYYSPEVQAALMRAYADGRVKD